MKKSVIFLTICIVITVFATFQIFQGAFYELLKPTRPEFLQSEFWGLFKTVMILSMFYLLGLVLLFVTAAAEGTSEENPGAGVIALFFIVTPSVIIYCAEEKIIIWLILVCLSTCIAGNKWRDFKKQITN